MLFSAPFSTLDAEFIDAFIFCLWGTIKIRYRLADVLAHLLSRALEYLYAGYNNNNRLLEFVTASFLRLVESLAPRPLRKTSHGPLTPQIRALIRFTRSILCCKPLAPLPCGSHEAAQLYDYRGKGFNNKPVYTFIFNDHDNTLLTKVRIFFGHARHCFLESK